MGNKIGRRQVVDEKYTRPQGLYHHKDIDKKKLRKLILESKLAPCYPGDEDCAPDLEECPICFLYYPSINRSRCCTKGICTECFLQMKPPHATRPTQCPFCKTSNYAVEYRGMKSKEEKGIEQVEEQKVIEAQIRVRQQELQDEAEHMKKRQDVLSSNIIMTPFELENNVPARTHNDVFPSPALYSGPTSMRFAHTRLHRDNNFDLDLEDIMVMEAIWLSIQEQGNQANPASPGSFLPEPSYPPEFYNPHDITAMKSSPSAGLACAAAALAERQHMNGETVHMISSNPATYDTFQQSDSVPAGNLSFAQNNSPGNWTEISYAGGREVVREDYGECSNGHWSTQTEASASYSGSDVLVDTGAESMPMVEGTNATSGHFVPESFEEQMMLAMAVSLAEARARMNNQEFSWL